MPGSPTSAPASGHARGIVVDAVLADEFSESASDGAHEAREVERALEAEAAVAHLEDRDARERRRPGGRDRDLPDQALVRASPAQRPSTPALLASERRSAASTSRAASAA